MASLSENLETPSADEAGIIRLPGVPLEPYRAQVDRLREQTSSLLGALDEWNSEFGEAVKKNVPGHHQYLTAAKKCIVKAAEHLASVNIPLQKRVDDIATTMNAEDYVRSMPFHIEEVLDPSRPRPKPVKATIRVSDTAPAIELAVTSTVTPHDPAELRAIRIATTTAGHPFAFDSDATLHSDRDRNAHGVLALDFTAPAARDITSKTFLWNGQSVTEQATAPAVPNSVQRVPVATLCRARTDEMLGVDRKLPPGDEGIRDLLTKRGEDEHEALIDWHLWAGNLKNKPSAKGPAKSRSNARPASTIVPPFSAAIAAGAPGRNVPPPGLFELIMRDIDERARAKAAQRLRETSGVTPKRAIPFKNPFSLGLPPFVPPLAARAPAVVPQPSQPEAATPSGNGTYNPPKQPEQPRRTRGLTRQGAFYHKSHPGVAWDYKTMGDIPSADEEVLEGDVMPAFHDIGAEVGAEERAAGTALSTSDPMPAAVDPKVKAAEVDVPVVDGPEVEVVDIELDDEPAAEVEAPRSQDEDDEDEYLSSSPSPPTPPYRAYNHGIFPVPNPARPRGLHRQGAFCHKSHPEIFWDHQTMGEKPVRGDAVYEDDALPPWYFGESRTLAVQGREEGSSQSSVESSVAAGESQSTQMTTPESSQNADVTVDGASSTTSAPALSRTQSFTAKVKQTLFGKGKSKAADSGKHKGRAKSPTSQDEAKASQALVRKLRKQPGKAPTVPSSRTVPPSKPKSSTAVAISTESVGAKGPAASRKRARRDEDAEDSAPAKKSRRS